MKPKNILQFLLFFLMMLLTFYTIFSKNDMSAILSSIKSLDPLYFCYGIAAACFFVFAEGFMIWYLLRCVCRESHLTRCIGYSFIGFFFSGITPSATGGQPVQLYYMKKDGISLADGTLTLMTVAVLYKFILVIIGISVLLFWKSGLEFYLGSYMILYYLGIFLNTLLVILLLLIMFHGEWMERIILKAEYLLVKIHICKPSGQRRDSIQHMIAGYKDTFRFLLCHKGKIAFVAVCTFLQRCSLFLLTYFIYRGLHLSESSILLIMVLQAAVYIAVDMLPLPGSQGISELMYHAVFSGIFAGGYLPASMCITRGLSFYMLLIIGAAVTLWYFLLHQKKTNTLSL